MKQLFTILLLCFTCTLHVKAQNYKQDFEKLCESGDTAKQLALLTKWEKAKPNDAELYIAYFNYYVSRSKTEIVTTVTNPASDNPKAKKSAKKQTGYTSEIGYLPEPLNQGFKYINTGITKYPTRLDMRFGKIYMLGETYKYTALTNEIVKMIDYSNTIQSKWKWTDNKPLDKPEEFMLSAVQEYVATIYTAGKYQADNMRKIAETTLKYYPKHVESLSDMGVACTMRNDLNGALIYFFKALKLSPKDHIVLNNIANIYDKKKDTVNAIKYYDLTYQYGDTETKELASRELKRLKQTSNKSAGTTTTKTTAKTKTTGTTTTTTKAKTTTTTGKKTTTATNKKASKKSS